MDIKQVIEQSPGYDTTYPDVFTDTIGLDIVVPDKKLHAVPSWGGKYYPKRRATLKISTWVGMSIGAVHYYGKIEIMGVNMAHDDNPNAGSFVDKKDYPLGRYVYELTLRRPLTQKEIDDAPDRWRCCHAGDMTDCFETEEEIVELAKEVFKARFSGDWEFYIEYSHGRKEKVDMRPKTITAMLVNIGRGKLNKMVEVRDMDELLCEVEKGLMSRNVSLEESHTAGEFNVYAGFFCVGKVKIIEQ